MIELYYNPKDPRHILVMHDGVMKEVSDRKGTHRTSEILLLEKHLNKIPDYQFLPSFTGVQRPVVFLEKKKVKDKWVYYCVRGLWHEIKTWCKESGIVCNGVYNISDYGKTDKKPDMSFQLTDFDMSEKSFVEYVNNWGLNLDLRPYQYKAIWSILHYRQSMSQLATRAGKTLMAYVIFRYMLEHGAKKILMVVPNINLVRQGVKDMKDYQEYFKSEEVWAQGEYCQCANLTIGTFQSLIKRCVPGKKHKPNKHYDPHFFDGYDVICIDECHKADCDSIKTIMKQEFVRDAKLIFGFSGTIPDANTIENYGVQAILGPMIQDISTMELVDAGYLAKPIVRQIRMHYEDSPELLEKYIKYGEYLCGRDTGEKLESPDIGINKIKSLPIVLRETKDLYEKEEYKQVLVDLCKAKGAALLNLEQLLAMNSRGKIDTIMRIISDWPDKNGIVFAHNEEYVDYLYTFLSENLDRPVYKIKGSTTNKKRETIKKAMNEVDKNAVLVASYGCVATGLTFSNIDWCIFAQSFKSPILVMQSIGRGLLKTEEKDRFIVYDLIDVFPTGRLEKHGKEKTKHYTKVGYEHSTRSENLKYIPIF